MESEYSWTRKIYDDWMNAIQEFFNNPDVSSKDKRDKFEKGCATHIRMLYTIRPGNENEQKANDAMRDVLFFSEKPGHIIEYITTSSPDDRVKLIARLRS